MRGKRNLTITEAAELTGLSRKAMARRVERGSVRSVLRSGRRLIPRAELARAGLLPAEGKSGADLLRDASAVQRAPVSREVAEEHPVLAVLVRELLDVLQRQAGEIAQYRALTAEAESLRLEREVAELRVRLSILEGARERPALERAASDEAMLTTQVPPDQAGPPFPSSGDRLWVPPSAVSARTRSSAETVAFANRVPPAHGETFGARLMPLALEILFIGLVAVLAWLADLRAAVAAAAVGFAWLVAATFEVVRWTRR